jgi:hypothetical protein
LSDPTVAHRDPATSFESYQQWLAAQKRERCVTHPERPWKVTISRDRTRTIYVKANS